MYNYSEFFKYIKAISISIDALKCDLDNGKHFLHLILFHRTTMNEDENTNILNIIRCINIDISHKRTLKCIY